MSMVVGSCGFVIVGGGGGYSNVGTPLSNIDTHLIEQWEELYGNIVL